MTDHFEQNVYTSAFDNSFHPTFITLPDGTISDVNLSALEVFGYSNAEFRDLKMNALFENYVSKIGNHSPKQMVKEELTAICKNKASFTCLYSSVNFRDPNGEYKCIVTVIDISEYKEREAGLAVEKERYDILAKATSDTIWDWDILNDKMQYNYGMTDMFGYELSEIENTEHWWQKKIHPDDLKNVTNKVNQVLKRNDTHMKFKYRFLCSDGTYKHIYDRAFLIFDSNNKPIRMIGAMQDVTDIRKYILSIRKQNLKLREISWTQSHVVRAPLARIMGFVNLIKTQPTLDLNIDEILDNIAVSASELDNAIRHIIRETDDENKG